jgi:hypothetical protein
VTAPGEFRQVHAVPAADVSDGFSAAQGRQIQRHLGQIDRRPLICIDRLAGRKIGVGPVLHVQQISRVCPETSIVTCHDYRP